MLVTIVVGMVVIIRRRIVVTTNSNNNNNSNNSNTTTGSPRSGLQQGPWSDAAVQDIPKGQETAALGSFGMQAFESSKAAKPEIKLLQSQASQAHEGNAVKSATRSEWDPHLRRHGLKAGAFWLLV